MASRPTNAKRDRLSIQKMPSTDSVESGYLRDEAMNRWLSSPADRSKADPRSDPKSFFDLESWGIHINGLGISTNSGHTTSSSPRSIDHEYNSREKGLVCSNDFQDGAGLDMCDRVSLAEAIIAPNVHKLSDSSVIEIHLRSFSESVSIMCSIDILKMKSIYFYDVLTKQEESDDLMSRSRIEICESSPFEAAALLECIHDSNVKGSIPWNSTFCRLSVEWAINDYVQSYADMIDSHVNKIISFVKYHNWRTNPGLLKGFECTVLLKDHLGTPKAITGIINEPVGDVPYSSIVCSVSASALRSEVGTIDEALSLVSRSDAPTPFVRESLINDRCNLVISEPFWIRQGQDCIMWISPDEYCWNKQEFEIAKADKRKFWEMMKLLHELPILNKLCRNRLKTPVQVAALFKREEFRSLWSPESPESLTNDALTATLVAKLHHHPWEI